MVMFAGMMACGSATKNAQKVNTPPKAAFVLPQGVIAGSPVAFSGAGTTDADGDVLNYSWDFGDRGRAGVSEVAHLFAVAGTYPVKLTVTDSAGASDTVEQSLVVGAPAAPTAFASISVQVTSSGSPIAGATLSVLNGGATASSDGQGGATLSVGVGVPQIVRVEAPGYTRQHRRLNLGSGTTTGLLKVSLATAGTPQTLTAVENGATLNAASGSRVTLPQGALETETGEAVTGNVQAVVSPVNVVADTASFPGKFEGLDPTAQTGLLLSWGTADFTFSQNGKPLNLAPGKRATIDIPIYSLLNADGTPLAEGDVFPLWSLDEGSGLWIQEGLGTVTASPTSSSGFVLRGEVGHFSWWNHDRFSDGYQGSGGCCIDSNYDGACDGPIMCYVRGRTNCAGSTCTVRRSEEAPPAWMAEDIISSGETRTLLFPAAYPVELEGFANNGTVTGRVVLSSTANTQVPFTLVLQPAQQAEPSQTITLPHDDNYVSGASGTSSTFEFDVSPSNSALLVSVERAGGSLLQGEVALFAPGAATALDTQTFSAAGATITRVVGAGRHKVRVTSSLNAPGGYRLVVKVIGSGPFVQSVVPAPNATLVARASTITVQLNSAVKSASVSSDTFVVTSPVGAVSGDYVVSGQTITFTPTSDLPAGVPIRVRLTTGLNNTLNLGLAQDYVWEFISAEALDTRMVVRSDGFGNAAALRNGEFAALYISQVANSPLFFARYVPGVGVTQIETLDEGVGYSVGSSVLSIASNTAGAIAVLWTRQASSPTNTWSVMARIYTPTQGWGEPVAIHSTTGFVQYGSIGIDAQGRALAVYHDGLATPDAWSHRYIPGTGWQARVQIDTTVDAPTTIEPLSMNSDGDAITGWRNTYNSYARVYRQESGTWSTISDRGDGTLRQVWMDDGGNAYVHVVSGGGVVRVERSQTLGATWDIPFTPNAGVAYDGNCQVPFSGNHDGVLAVGACKANSAQPFIQRRPTSSWSAWDEVTDLAGTSTGVVRSAISVNPSGAVDVVHTRGFSGPAYYYRYASGAWSTTPSTSDELAALLFLMDAARLMSSDEATVIWQTSPGLSFIRIR